MLFKDEAYRSSQAERRKIKTLKMTLKKNNPGQIWRFTLRFGIRLMSIFRSEDTNQSLIRCHISEITSLAELRLTSELNGSAVTDECLVVK